MPTSFDHLKQSMLQEPILALVDHTKPYEEQIDASKFFIGGVLKKEGHLIAYESRQLNDTK